MPLAPARWSSIRTIGKVCHRAFSERPAGVGGLWSNKSPLNPSQHERYRRNHRLQDLNDHRLELRLPKELRELSEDECDDEELRDLIESRIQNAMNEGEFDNLPGKGKPLKEVNECRSSAHTDRSLDLVMRIMKQNNIKPPWIELMNDIDREKRLIRRDLKRAWKRFMACASDQRPDLWEFSLRLTEQRMKNVNRGVDHFNLTKPQSLLHLFRLRMRLPDEVDLAMKSG